MSGSVSIRRSLLSNLVLVVALLGMTILVVRFFGTQRSLRRTSEALMTQALERVDLMLDGFFDPIVWQLEIVRDWSRTGAIDLDRPEELDRILQPVFVSRPWIASVGVADRAGREYRTMPPLEGRLRARRIDRENWGDRVVWWYREEIGAPIVEEEDWSDYDPRQRPWFQGALALHERTGGAAGIVDWTEPYRFYLSGDPGISVSVALEDAAGELVVVSVDLRLDAISRFTGGITLGEEGAVFVLSSDGRLVGLPRSDGGRDADRSEDLLRLPSEVDSQFASDAAAALLDPDSPAVRPERFSSGGQAWWGEVRPFELPGSETELLVGVVVPERDLLSDLVGQRLWIGAISLLAVALAVVRAVVVAGRYSQPIEDLVEESNRIGTGDLEAGAAIESNVAEIRQLAEAHDRMRLSLRTLLKIEQELQLAKEIQERTFPEALPRVRGYDLAAWNEPADETGGDSYDVLAVDPETGNLSDAAESAGRIGFLLADATGHGVGPAISVTQLRAMVRMAVRLSVGLEELIAQINEQLCADLPTGRFITAWFATLDPANHRLAIFSAGQAPLLHYRAATDEFVVSDANAMPLGLFPGMRVVVPEALELAPGDVYAAISDGIFEAARADEEEFGLERVQEVIRASHRAGAAKILRQLRQEVDRFTDHAPAADDKTVVLIRRAD
jgi:serine phosphatase RsbU (regulator of sigma subunit)